MSDYNEWKVANHSDEWLIFPENLGKRISIDELVLTPVFSFATP